MAYFQLKDPNGPLRGTSHGMDLYFEFDMPPNDLDQLILFYADLDPVKLPVLERAFRDLFLPSLKLASHQPSVSALGLALI